MILLKNFGSNLINCTESQFSSLVNASELFSDFSDPSAKILVHGTVNGYLKAKDGLVLFDYKTDFVDKTNEEQAIEKLNKNILDNCDYTNKP